MIFEYKQDNTEDGRLIKPNWVEEGGMFYDPSDYTFVGYSPTVRPYKIPSTVITIGSLVDLKARCQSIHSSKPFTDFNIEAAETFELTTTQVDILATNWWDTHQD